MGDDAVRRGPSYEVTPEWQSRVIHALKMHDMTRADLAGLLGVSRTAITDLLRHEVSSSRLVRRVEIELGMQLAVTDPTPMRLPCERCGELHIDEGEFATKPHHTHACQHCGAVWRPAIIPTVGVRFLPGFRNEPKEAT